MKIKKYTYPRIHFEREMQGDKEEVPVVMTTFTSLVVTQSGNEEVVQLISFYPYYGKRDVECEVDSADVFHQMCREKYFEVNEEEEDIPVEKPIDESNITFNEDDERW